MKLTKVLPVALMTMELCLPSRGSNTVHDPIHTGLNIAQQVYGQVKQELQHTENVSKYTTMIQKQVEQIDQLTSIISQDAEQLRRLGNPNTYVNMLGLDDLLDEVNKMKSGVGKTVEEFRQTADGLAALKNTGEGLYQDFSGMPDKFGRKVLYTTENFKKFGVVQDMYEDFNHQLTGANQSIGRLESEVANTAHQINSAGSLVETEKLKAKLQAVEGAVNTSIRRATLAALKVLVQGESNRNEQARAQEAVRERKAQEMETENQQLYMLGGRLLGPSGTP
jgi:archaellum component FlaC